MSIADPRRGRTLEWVAWNGLRQALDRLNVQMDDVNAVQFYLDAHPDMTAALEEICQLARREFGAEAALNLSVCIESGTGEKYLRVLLRLPTYDENTGKRLRAVYDEYEKKFHFDRAGWIFLTTDFINAR